MQAFIKLTILLFFTSKVFWAQESKIDEEFKMTFPSIYFKHKSTDYAIMPYTVDSCFKHIALNYNRDLNSMVIWRDSAETEELTSRRIKKLNAELRKYIKSGVIEIYSMEQKQKISRYTINMSSNESKVDYLLTLNSVFEISKTQISRKKIKKKKERKGIPHLVWTGWKTGFHWSSAGGMSKKKKSSK